MATIIPASEAGAIVGTFVGGPPGALIGAFIGGGVAAFGSGVALCKFYWKFREDMKKAKAQALKKKDPKYFKETIENLSQEFIMELSKLHLNTVIQKKINKTDVVFFGATSAGKSSLISHLFNVKLKIGLGQTTNQTSMVYQDEKKRIWDSVGQNQDFQFYQLDTVTFFNAVDIIFIVYRDTIKAIKHMVKLISLPQNRRYKVYFVRSQCDQWKSNHQKSIDQEIMADYQILINEYKVKNPIILKSSAVETESSHFQNQNSKILKIIQEK